MNESNLPNRDEKKRDPEKKELLPSLPLYPVRGSEPTGSGGKSSYIGPIVAVTIVVAGAVFLLVENSEQGCHGATRSAKLTWQQQQEEMQQAVDEAKESPKS
jgi:hypothetical protein